MFIDSTGLSPCCNTVTKFGLSGTVDEYLNHPKLKEFQISFLTGQKPQACSMCWTQELIQNKSMRLDGIRDYNNNIYTESDIDFVHYSQNNICNFKCRSCAAQYSNGIANEMNKHFPQNKKNFKSKFLSVTKDNSDWVIQNLAKIKRLLITGGEPTVMPDVKKIFENLLEFPQPNLQIMVTTNCSWQDEFWYQVIKTMPNLHITASVDAIGSPAELIRHGTNWNQIEKNLKWLSKNAHSLDINTVISCLNIGHLYPLLKFCIDLQNESKAQNGGKQGDLGSRHQFSVATSHNLSIMSFPDLIKNNVVDHLKHCLDLPLDTEQENMVNGLLNKILDSQFDQKIWNQVVEYNTLLDNIRGENHEQLLLK